MPIWGWLIVGYVYMFLGVLVAIGATEGAREVVTWRDRLAVAVNCVVWPYVLLIGVSEGSDGRDVRRVPQQRESRHRRRKHVVF